MFDGGVFGGQAECIPAHGLQHVFAQHALVAGDHITNGVVTHVAHVQAATGVGEHRQAIELFFIGVGDGFKNLILFPVVLYGRLNLLRLICLLHGVCVRAL